MSKEKQNLQLTCIITGKTRSTNTAYLEKKAAAAGSAEAFTGNYLSRDAAKLLRQGLTVPETREVLGAPNGVPEVSEDRAKMALSINGSRVRRKQKELEVA